MAAKRPKPEIQLEWEKRMGKSSILLRITIVALLVIAATPALASISTRDFPGGSIRLLLGEAAPLALSAQHVVRTTTF